MTKWTGVLWFGAGAAAGVAMAALRQPAAAPPQLPTPSSGPPLSTPVPAATQQGPDVGMTPDGRLEDCLIEVEWCRVRLEGLEGKSMAWPLAPDWRPAAVTARVKAKAAGDPHPDARVLDVDCDEFPCILWVQWDGATSSASVPNEWLGTGEEGLWAYSSSVSVPVEDDVMTLHAVSLAPVDAEEREAIFRRTEHRMESRTQEMLQRALN